jgi:hypothetical protein
MDALNIQIKDKTFRLDFSLLAFYNLGEKWGLDSLEDVYAKISSMDDGEEKFSFKKVRLFSEIVEVLANTSEENETKLKFEDVLRLSAEELMVMFQSFTLHMVKNNRSEIENSSDNLGKEKAPSKQEQ